MWITKEGLHVYAVCEYEDNSYYYSTEYPVIKHNEPESLLEIQIREHDGKKRVYYDITGNSRLSEWGRNKIINYEECRAILQGILELLYDVEECMLSLEQIHFDKESIYIDTAQKLHWIYGPDASRDIKTDMETLFLWIISMVDYKDNQGVQLVYRAYHGMREGEFSRVFLENCLDIRAEDPLIQVCETTFEEEKNPIISKEEGFSWVKIALVAALGLDLLMITYLGFLIFTQGYSERVILSLLAGFVLLILLVGVLVYRIRRMNKAKRGSREEEARDIPCSIPEEKKRKKTGGSIFEELDDYWEQGDETVLLSQAYHEKVASLEEWQSKRSVKLQVFPFYIGSEDGLNQLPIHNKTISHQHAVITRRQGDSYYLEDLESRNGTTVDGIPVIPEKPVLLHDGSNISFANEVWIFHF